MTYFRRHFFLSACVLLCAFVLPTQVIAERAGQPQVLTSNQLNVKHIAPGGVLPITVKLMNFGSSNRVDVSVYYTIMTPAGDEVLSAKETVAVETTASFVKKIQLPSSISPGQYVATSRIVYQNQEFPASSSFDFVVERQIFGVFISDFLLYAGITIMISLSLVLLSHLLITKRSHRFVAHSYDTKPKHEQIYFEMISDVIAEMRVHKGDDALTIASKVPGLTIDEQNGKVIDIEGSPAEIMTLLMIAYEKKFGKKVSVKKGNKKSGSKKSDFEKNLAMFKKYFQ